MKWKTVLAGSIILAVVVCVTTLTKREVVNFDGLQTAKAKFIAAGFYCVADSVDEQIWNGFMITREDVSTESVVSMCKVGEMGSAWKGKVWVTLNPGHWKLEAIPDDAATRTWGKVVAFGDAELMRELDGILGQTARHF